jgi:hypothetical protein
MISANAHRLAWEHLARPGSWWTADQRLELANTAIGAIADVEPLPPWASVSAVEGRLRADHVAPAIAHDVTYRIARHTGTITEDLFDNVSGELGPLPYVELVSIVTTVAAVTHFCRNIGIDLPPLPEPQRGDPTGMRRVPGGGCWGARWRVLAGDRWRDGDCACRYRAC